MNSFRWFAVSKNAEVEGARFMVFLPLFQAGDVDAGHSVDQLSKSWPTCHASDLPQALGGKLVSYGYLSCTYRSPSESDDDRSPLS